MQGIVVLLLGELVELVVQVEGIFFGGVEVIFDMIGFWFEVVVLVLVVFGCLVIIVVLVDGYVCLLVLNLYCCGGLVVGINLLFYGVEVCVGFFDVFGKLFD